MTIKLEPGDLEACDAAMRWEKAQEDYALARADFTNKVANVDDKEIAQEIQDKGLTAPRVTLANIEGCIAYEYYINGSQVPAITTAVLGPTCAQIPTQIDISPLISLTLCVLVLKNGFTVTGESACASPDNFDEELGRKIARQKAVDKVWALEGYLLKERLYRDAINASSGGGDFGDS
jgi:Phage protein (N4 Gp49/phage Sf6 gene 66) family